MGRGALSTIKNRRTFCWARSWGGLNEAEDIWSHCPTRPSTLLWRTSKKWFDEKKKGERFMAQSVRKLLHAIWHTRKALLTNFYLPFANFSVNITGGCHSEMLMIFCSTLNHICLLFMLLLYNLNQRHDNTKEIRMCAIFLFPTQTCTLFFLKRVTSSSIFVFSSNSWPHRDWIPFDCHHVAWFPASSLYNNHCFQSLVNTESACNVMNPFRQVPFSFMKTGKRSSRKLCTRSDSLRNNCKKSNF